MEWLGNHVQYIFKLLNVLLCTRQFEVTVPSQIPRLPEQMVVQYFLIFKTFPGEFSSF